MRRVTLILLPLAVISIFGTAQNLSGAPPLHQAQTPPSEPGAQPKASSGDAWTAFWGQLSEALRKNDKAVLFKLTDKARFYWEAGKIDLPKIRDYPAYTFPDFASFERVYKIIFSAKLKKKFLNSKLHDTKENGFYIVWVERGLSFSLNFFETNGTFSYGGLLVGPA